LNPTSGASGCRGDDFIRVGLPSEGFGAVVCDVSIDGSLQIDADKGAAFEASFGQHGEEAFNCVEP
jgi:hypothetical protein